LHKRVVVKEVRRCAMEAIKNEAYSVTYDPASATVVFQGVLRVHSYTSYLPLERLLNDVVALKPPVITLDIHELTFINSSGIDVIYRFAYKASSQAHSDLIVRRLASGAPWQERLVRTIEVMAPNLQVELVEGQVPEAEPTS
jgi:hypothetical protein